MHPSDLPQNRLLVIILAASLASTIGGLPFNALPVMLGSLADSFSLDAQATGLLGSTCFCGYLLGTLGAPIWMNRLNWRTLTLSSAAGTALSFALSSQIKDLPLLYVMWALIGFFAATMTCLGIRILSDLPNKVRAFGVRQGVELSVTAAVLFALPPLVIAHFRYPGAAMALAAVVALLGLSVFWVPQGPLVPVAAGVRELAVARYRLPLAAWRALAVFFLFLVGNIGLWAFLERIGSNLNIEPADMGIVFAVLKLLGSVAAFSVAALGERLGLRRASWLVLLVIGLGLLTLFSARTFPLFATGAWIWEFAFTCGCIFQTAEIARCDTSGRAIVLVPAAFALSSIAGPGLAGMLAAQGSYTGVLGFALASTLLLVAGSLWSRAKV
ncbi:MAG: MFS transporter [Burkholderiales bacterium]